MRHPPPPPPPQQGLISLPAFFPFNGCVIAQFFLLPPSCSVIICLLLTISAGSVTAIRSSSTSPSFFHLLSIFSEASNLTFHQRLISKGSDQYFGNIFLLIKCVIVYVRGFVFVEVFFPCIARVVCVAISLQGAVQIRKIEAREALLEKCCVWNLQNLIYPHLVSLIFLSYDRFFF